VVVLVAKAVERPLLHREATPRGSNRLGLERLMHALVRTILLRMRGQDPLVLNAEPQPPYIERRQAVKRHRCEGHAVVGANGPRQPVGAEQTIEDRADAGAIRRQQALTPEQVARVLIGDRQRIAVDPIAGPELAFEIGRPQIVGVRRGRCHHTRMREYAAAAPLLHQAFARQEITRGADRRQVKGWMPRRQPLQEFFRF